MTRKTLFVACAAISGLLGAAAPQQILVKSHEHYGPRAEIAADGVNGAFLVAGDVDHATIGPAIVTGAYRAVEAKKASSVSDLQIVRLTAHDLQRDGIRLRSAERTRIIGFDLAMRAEPQVRPHLPEGIAIAQGRDITIANGKVRGFRMKPRKGKYPNGDGIALERGVHGVTIANVVSESNSDAGFDLKSSDTRLDNVVAKDNFRGFRFWGTARAGKLRSDDSHNAALWFGKGADVTIDHLIVHSRFTAPILRIEGARRISIGSCSLDVPAGTKFAIGSLDRTDLQLGRGCHLEKR